MKLARAARAAIALAAIALGLLVASGPLYQLGLLTLPAAYTGLRLAASVGVLAGAISVVAVVMAVRQRRVAYAVVGATAALTSIAAVVIPIRAEARARLAPPIADISTDLEHPPAFVLLADLPDGRTRNLTRPPRLNDLQRRVYPDISPLTVPTPPDMAFEEVLETFTELEWQTEDASEQDGRIEASVRSGWFGFKDDVVVRLTPVASGTRVDIRSLARDPATDMGRNAENVRAFLEEMRR